MSTLSVPLSPELEESIERLVKQGSSPNKAALARKAIEQYVEDEAVLAVLKSEQEVKEGRILKGNLRTLLKK